MAIKIGRTAEDFVVDYMRKKGCEVIAKNVTFPFGEIDLIVKDQETLVFLEVKYRKSLSFGYPFESVGRTKQKRIIKAAKAYLNQWTGPLPYCRFDVVSLSGDLLDPVVEYFEDAFLDEV